jgi:glycosyltransferase involved in cell wall biosynthesis
MEKDFSIVIPVYNEDESLRELLSAIKKALDGHKKTYEVIFIDDGSTDRTLEILKNMQRDNKNIRVYSFRKNLGKSPALMHGFAHARGKFLVTMDADLQDDPVNIMPLYQKLTKGEFDLVTGWRKDRKDKITKIMSSKLFNRIIVPFLFGVNLNDLNSGLKIYRHDLARELKIYGGMHRFIPIIASEMGYRVSEKDIVHHHRKYGVSKYKATKILTDIPDLLTIFFITKYNRRPLHFFGKLGGAIFGLGSIILLYLAYLRFFENAQIGDRPLLLFGMLLVLAGIQIVAVGLIADLVVSLNANDRDNLPLKYSSDA